MTKKRTFAEQALADEIIARTGKFQFTCETCRATKRAARRRRRFCDSRCRAAFHNRERVQITEADISNWLQANPCEVPSLLNQVYATVQEAAQLTGKSETTIRKWIKQQRVKAEIYNGRHIILRSDLARFMNEGAATFGGPIKAKLKPLNVEVNNEQSTNIVAYSMP